MRWPLPLLLLLLLLEAPRSFSAKRSKEQPPSTPSRPPLPVDSLLNLAQVPDPTLSSSSSSSSALSSSSRRNHLSFTVTDSDLIYATGSCRDRMNLARSTRAWRRGLIRAFVLTDQNNTDSVVRLNAEGAPHNESYAFFPDEGDPLLDGVRHGTKQGDTRAALAPFAAHRHFGDSYKWMLYGDDDTLFFPEAVKRMLSAYDPALPLAFSDNLWHHGLQPNPHAPRCLPCHMAGQELPSLERIQSTPAMRDQLRKYLRDGKASDARLKAAARAKAQVPGWHFLPRPVCPYCTPEGACPLEPHPEVDCTPAVPHGGAGMIFSVGLLRSIPYAAALACLRSFVEASGGDALVAYCLWRHGYAFTDPGPLVQHLYDPHYHVFGGRDGLAHLWDPVGSMTHGRCNGTCRWMLHNTISMHLKGSHLRSWRLGSLLMWAVSHATDAARSFLDTVARDGGAAWRDLPYGADVDDTGRASSYDNALPDKD